jgi:outer membrane murein-binding lipoprotein Lpp
MSTLTLYKAFKAMGAPDEAAEQAAAAVDEYLAGDLSRLETKIDRLDARIDKLDTRIDKLDAKTEARFGKTDDVLAELKSDVKLLRWMITFIGGLCLLILGKLFI